MTRPALRRGLGLGLGVALPTLLLALGWLLAGLREQGVLAARQAERLGQAADLLRAAVREGLEELRRREDARPFEHWDRFYRPPEVLALGEALALSPLAARPDDPRVLGYFQVDPGERVRTPYALDPGGSERARELEARVAAAEFAPLRALAFGPAADPALLADRGAEAPLTTSLNELNKALYRDISEGNRGDAYAAQRAQRAQVPQTKRNLVSWREIQHQQAVSAPLTQQKHAEPVFEAAQQRALEPPPQAAYPSEPVPQDIPSRPLTDLDYSPMTYLRVGDALVLQRVVSHGGAGSVQGVLLDRAHLAGGWIPAVLARHALPGLTPRLVEGRDPSCALTRPLDEEVLPGLGLCFAAPEDPGAGDLALQAAALLGLVVVVVVALLAIARAARRADELSAQKTAFVSAVSHELRTPLTTLRMHAEMLQEGLIPPARLGVFYDDLVHESVRLSRLVENVLAVAQLEEGRRVLKLQPGDLAAQLREIVAAQARHVERRGAPPVELALPGEPVLARFDAAALDQILVNLLDNALKYAGGAGLRVALELEPGWARIHVQDRGPGIPEADRERVFERFYRVPRERDAHTPGTGLGLALVRELARGHGGDVRAAPRPGGGTDLQVSLPLGPTAPA